MKIRNYVRPTSVKEAYELVAAGGTVIGGGAWLKLMPKTIESAVDISDLELDQLRETDENLYLGSMMTLRDVEIHPLLQTYMGGVVSEAASNIMGVNVRNIATIGGTVVGRYGFSDLLPTLLALGADLHFHHSGTISLEDYLKGGLQEKDVLTEIQLKKEKGKAKVITLKKTSTDFPVLNVAACSVGNHIRLAIGARPGAASLAYEAMTMINHSDSRDEGMLKAVAEKAVEELSFGSNTRGTAEYRQEVAKSLVVRALKEVLA